MEIRNIGPAWGEAGAPTMVLTWVTSPGAGARSETGAGLRIASGLCRRRGEPGQFLVLGDHVAFMDQKIGNLGPLLLDADHRFPARHDKSGDPHQIGEAGIGGLGDNDEGAAWRVFVLGMGTMLDPVIAGPKDDNADHRQRRLEIFGERHRRINPELWRRGRGFGCPGGSGRAPQRTSVPQAGGTHCTAKSGLSHDRFTGSHLEAVALFVIDDLTRRFASAMGGWDP